MIDKQSIINDPNVKWQSVADKKWGTYGDIEANALRGAASRRVGYLVHHTNFIGAGGAQINLDGTYEVKAHTTSELADAKLKEMLQKTFEEDEELNTILGKLRDLHLAKQERSAAAKQNSPKAGAEIEKNGDSFVRSEPPDAPLNKWQEQERLRNEMVDKIHGSLYITQSPADEGAVRRVEDWIRNGGEYPDDFIKFNIVD